MVTRIARIALSAMVFVVALEALARLDDHFNDGAPLTGNHSIDSLFMVAPGYKAAIPGAHFGKWHINSLGMRGPEAPPGRMNVLTYGASETFGIYERPDQEFPRQLERLLNSTAPGRYAVLNAAVPGLRMGRMGYFRQMLDRARPQVVVVYPTPAAYIGATKPYCADTSPAPAATQLVPAEPTTFKPRLGAKVERVFKDVAPLPLMTWLKSRQLDSAEKQITVMPRLPDATIDAFRADLMCIQREVAARGATLVLLTHATLFGQAVTPATHPMLVAWRRFNPELAEAGFLDMERRANQAVLDVAARHPDIRLVRIDQVVTPDATHFADFVHFTDLGASQVAQAVARAIAPTP